MGDDKKKKKGQKYILPECEIDGKNYMRCDPEKIEKGDILKCEDDDDKEEPGDKEDDDDKTKEKDDDDEDDKKKKKGQKYILPECEIDGKNYMRCDPEKIEKGDILKCEEIDEFACNKERV